MLRMCVESEKILHQTDCVFMKIDALERWKKIIITYRVLKKLLSFKNAGKPASSQNNLRHLQDFGEKVYKTKIVALKN